MISYHNRQITHDEIDHIFKDLFPSHGMTARPSQIELSHKMLEAMLHNKIALSDAGTGIGKTYAYLVAGVSFSRALSREGVPFHPILVSTSSIALQTAVKEEYIPFLSSVLMENKLIQAPIRAVIRKGKSHYVCDERLLRRLRQVDLERKNPQAAHALLSLRDHLDTDQVPNLSQYDRNRVCVPPVCDCRRDSCRYLCYMDACSSDRYLFQICNHNLLLADAIHRGSGHKPILPDTCALVVDEAHKLPETARQMFGITLASKDIRTLIRTLRAERYLLASESLAEMASALLDLMSMPPDGDRPFSDYVRHMIGPARTLATIQKQIGGVLTPTTRKELDRVSSTIHLLLEERADLVFYTAMDDDGSKALPGSCGPAPASTFGCTLLSIQRSRTPLRPVLLQHQIGSVQLPLIVLVDGHLDGQDVVAQAAVSFAAVLGGDGRALRADEQPFFQLRHILAHCAHAHTHMFCNLPVAEQTLIGLAVFAAQQETVDHNGTPGQIQIVELIGQREIIFDRITLGPSLLSHFAPPACSSAH